MFDNEQCWNGCNINWTLGSRFPLDAALAALNLLSSHTCVWMTRCTLNVRSYLWDNWHKRAERANQKLMK